MFSQDRKSGVEQPHGFSLCWLSHAFQGAGALHLYQLLRLPSPLQALPPTLGFVIRRLEPHTHFCFAGGSHQNRPLEGAGERPWGWRRDFLLLSASLQQPLFTWQRPFLLNQFAVFPTDTASWYPLLRAWVQAAVGSYSKLRDASTRQATPPSLRSTFRLHGTLPLCSC